MIMNYLQQFFLGRKTAFSKRLRNLPNDFNRFILYHIGQHYATNGYHQRIYNDEYWIYRRLNIFSVKLIYQWLYRDINHLKYNIKKSIKYLPY